MLTYNTQLPPLPLPEYGRNIQTMVDYCLTISDREERTACAYSILAAMANLFHELKAQGGEYKHKLWDHLMIMSDFRLDIDFPCEVITRENLRTRPDTVAYTASPIRFRHYGKNIQHTIDAAAEMEEGPEREELIRLIANQMKKSMLEHNADGIDDSRVFNDLAIMSEGRIRITPGQIKLREFVAPPKPTSKKRKKK